VAGSTEAQLQAMRQFLLLMLENLATDAAAQPPSEADED
jgi:hypothetical protein